MEWYHWAGFKSGFMGIEPVRNTKETRNQILFFPDKYVVYSTNLVTFKYTRTFYVVVICGVSHQIKNTDSGGCRSSSVSTVSVCEVDKISPYGAKVKNAGSCVSIAPWPHRYTMVPFNLFQVLLENIKTYFYSVFPDLGGELWFLEASQISTVCCPGKNNV